MRLAASKLWNFSCIGLLALTLACGDDKGEEAEGANEAGTETGDGDGDDEVGDGDGEPGDGDGEPGDGDGEPGDGDGEPGDGDGDGEAGDGDGEPGDGDGDGEPGDGDGEPNPECFDLDEEECGMNPDCQPVNGAQLKENGPGSPCLEPAEFLGCIGMQGCGDAITWFCQNNNTWQVNDTCGPEGAEQCEAPMEPVEACP